MRSAPAQAIIAPLSVHSAGGGMISVVCAFAATSCSAARMESALLTVNFGSFFEEPAIALG